MSTPPRRGPTADITADLRARAHHAMPRFTGELAGLVGIDSGSHSPDGVDRVGNWVAGALAAIGFDVRSVPTDRSLGNVVVARSPGPLDRAAGGRRVLLVGHLDTVFDDGTAAGRPFTVRDGRAHGPGVCDDKGGLLAGLTALRLLRESGLRTDAEIVFVATPDEEIGSPGSAPVLRAAAQGVDCALVLEGARENGDLVIGRKGVADFEVVITGRAAHAGIEPERGADAALAAAHLVLALQALNGRWEDVTVNVGVIRAGSRANVVCPTAELRLEVRACSSARIEHVSAEIVALAQRCAVTGTTAAVRRLGLCSPLEPDDRARRMLAHARALGGELGLSFGAVTTGGVGDANHLGALGVPTLDGLGPVGGGDHSPAEWLDLAGAADRIALLAALVHRLGVVSVESP